MEESKPLDAERQRQLEAWQRSKAKSVKFFIERSRVLYARNRNPIHAFTAYRIARRMKLDIPGWVLELFDQWAKALCVERPKGGNAIVAALGLKGSGGGPSITAQAVIDSRDMFIAESVAVLIEGDPKPAMLDVFNQVADEYSLSSERVASIWYELARPVKR